MYIYYIIKNILKKQEFLGISNHNKKKKTYDTVKRVKRRNAICVITV